MKLVTEASSVTTPKECVADGKSAVRYLRVNAARLGLDPNRIAAGGGSAGGHVAAATGTLPGLDDPADDTSVSSRPNAPMSVPYSDDKSCDVEHDQLDGNISPRRRSSRLRRVAYELCFHRDEPGMESSDHGRRQPMKPCS